MHAWAPAGQALFTDAATWTAAARAGPCVARERARLRFEPALLALCRAQPAGGPHAALCQRVERDHPELFTCVADPPVPPTNNAAERALRPLVIARKISGGARPSQGSRPRMLLQSLLAAPQTPILELSSVRAVTPRAGCRIRRPVE